MQNNAQTPCPWLGKRAKLTNVNPFLYKYKTEGIIDWVGVDMVRFEGYADIYRKTSVKIIDLSEINRG